ncbi:MAG: hypothetical protein CVU57_08255 [Deltaproteobacteria bacterium HGW-Deltaproteobacteria-15]|nr:MAG: hypothetical protein CVU57_08255 [Deltaproteobacteria bacterium HGW-Deltaproteobacteria-15]
MNLDLLRGILFRVWISMRIEERSKSRRGKGLTRRCFHSKAKLWQCQRLRFAGGCNVRKYKKLAER